MKKEMKVLSIVLISVMFLSLVVGIASAATPYDDFKAWIISAGESTIFAQVLLFILVALIIYSISTFVPIIGEQSFAVKTAISIVVAILSTFWLVPGEVYSILQSYNTLGIVLTTFLPIILLLTFTIRLNQQNPRYAIIGKFIWIAFIIILTMKFLGPLWIWFTTGTIPVESGGYFGAVAYGLTLVAGLIMIFWGEKLAFAILKSSARGGMRKFKGLSVAALEAEANTLEKEKTNLDPKSIEYETIQKRLKDIEAMLSATRTVRVRT